MNAVGFRNVSTSPTFRGLVITTCAAKQPVQGARESVQFIADGGPGVALLTCNNGIERTCLLGEDKRLTELSNEVTALQKLDPKELQRKISEKLTAIIDWAFSSDTLEPEYRDPSTKEFLASQKEKAKAIINKCDDFCIGCNEIDPDNGIIKNDEIGKLKESYPIFEFIRYPAGKNLNSDRSYDCYG